MNWHPQTGPFSWTVHSCCPGWGWHKAGEAALGLSCAACFERLTGVFANRVAIQHSICSQDYKSKVLVNIYAATFTRTAQKLFVKHCPSLTKSISSEWHPFTIAIILYQYIPTQYPIVSVVRLKCRTSFTVSNISFAQHPLVSLLHLVDYCKHFCCRSQEMSNPCLMQLRRKPGPWNQEEIRRFLCCLIWFRNL